MSNRAEVTTSILIWAFRYALGRSTYAVSDVATTLISNRDVLSPGDKELIVREIEEAIQNGQAGMDMDVREWELVKDALTPAFGDIRERGVADD